MADDFERFLRSKSWDLPTDYGSFRALFTSSVGSARPEMLAAFLMSMEAKPMPLPLLRECVAELEREGVPVPQVSLDRLKDGD